MAEETIYADRFENQIRSLFQRAWQVTLQSPVLAFRLLLLLVKQSKAARLRRAWENKGLHVPPIMIASITHSCNLKCRGCYAQALRHGEKEMDQAAFSGILKEAAELGISIVLIAGGEPLTRPDILDAIAAFPEIVFPLFTNGLLMDEKIMKKISKTSNVIPVISLEGQAAQTDERRGSGVYAHLTHLREKLKGSRLFWGVSVTLTRSNYAEVTRKAFAKPLLDSGCRLFFFVEYVPVQPGTEDLVLTDEQRTGIPKFIATLQKELPGMFIAFPGDESGFGGCLSSGRGFIHVSPEGNLEPCPFAPFSDANLTKLSLREALQSEFLKTLRENHERLSEAQGGCALWANRDWVQGLLNRAPEGSHSHEK